ISGNGAGANTMQASIFAPGSHVGNFTDPLFQWMLTAHGSEGFNPIVTQLQLSSLYVANYTVSNLWVGDAEDFFALPAFGDFNADGLIDMADLERWTTGAGMPSGASHWQGDADGDGDADGADFLNWQRRIGTSQNVAPASMAADAVPEPSAGVQAMLGLLSLLPRGRSRELHSSRKHRRAS
ncbi:MAG TPA: hypothetical protein VF175_01710, partial [Lacipirellula sp.]